ncbi:hypothetical protein RB195_008785 [Necator americanus]|uniref:Uncharacterized protein n=1 Tax=Necator americanus TaxID=51031 RepID=A0ABR1CQD9_NECAM
MDKRRSFATHQDHSRPDRSRSPHRNSHPWEKSSEPKSVLYSSEVQFHRRSPNKYTQQPRSISKPSSSMSASDSCTFKPSKIPLKERSQTNRTRTTSYPQSIDTDASAQRLVERLQKWNSMHSPSKFMAGMMSKDGIHELPDETTPKRRSRGPWFVEYFTKSPEKPEERSKKETHPSRKNIIKIEKENRRTDDYLTRKITSERTPSPKGHSRLDGPLSGVSSVVETDKYGYAIPSIERSGRVTPVNRKLEPTNFITPCADNSPNEAFFTPMTHIRPRERQESNVASHSQPSLDLTFTQQKPQFSLINTNREPSVPLFERDPLIKERIENQLAEYERASSKLDMALQEASEVLSRPIKLGLPPLNRSSNLPAFGDERQTIDSGQLEKLRYKENVESSPRCSLPLKTSESTESTRLSRTFLVTHDKESDLHGAYAVSPVREKKPNNEPPRSDISLPKALGASMAAELAYAEKTRHIQSHLKATHDLANDVRRRSAYHAQVNNDDDIDRILDSISLREESLMTYDQSRDESIMNGSVMQTKSSIHHQYSNVAIPLEKKVFVLNEEERRERKKKVEEYIEMCNVLRYFKQAVYKLKRKCTTTPVQLRKIDELSKAADLDYSEAAMRAKSWLNKKITQGEFLLLVKQHKKKVYDESEDCANTIKQLIAQSSSSTGTTSGTQTPSLNPPSISEKEISPVRIDTKGLNESVECDIFNLSARSLRRSLDARREEAEMLNRSFEERSRDIEQRTKVSIAAQIVQYDRVIAERTTLLNKLDEISSEESHEPPRTTTPRRAGVEPLDLSKLSSEEVVPLKEANNALPLPVAGDPKNYAGQDQTDVGISRAYSQSTIYEDSLSHFDEEEDSRPDSVSSEATLYQSDLEDKLLSDVEKVQTDVHPSRRTLDTAETLTMLSRQVVTIVSDKSSHDEVDQMLVKIVEEASEHHHEHAIEVRHVVSKSSEHNLSVGELKPSTFSCGDHASPQMQGIHVDGIGHTKEERSKKIQNEAGDITGSPHESARVEVSMTNSQKTESGAEVRLPDKNAARSDERVGPVTIETLELTARSPLVRMESEENEEEKLSREKITSASEPVIASTFAEATQEQVTRVISPKEVEDENLAAGISVEELEKEKEYGKLLEEDFYKSTDFESTQWENTGPTSSPIQKTREEPMVGQDSPLSAEELNLQKEFAENITAPIDDSNWLSDDEPLSSVEPEEKQDNHETGTIVEPVISTGEHEESIIKTEESKDDTNVFKTEGPVEGPAEFTNSDNGTTRAEVASISAVTEGGDVLSDSIPEDIQVDSEKTKQTTAEEESAVVSSGVEDKSECKREKDPYELSFLDRTTDGRASLGLNRSELVDSLSTSIMQSIGNSPRRSLPRSYNLNESLFEDSIVLSTPKSPRSARERFNTKMPTAVSPRTQMILDQGLDTSVSKPLISEAQVTTALCDDVLSELDKEVEKLSARIERRSTTSTAQPLSQDLAQLDDTYEDLLSIEKPSSQLHPVLSTVESNVETLLPHVADTPRKPPPPQVSPPSAEEIKQKRMEELRERVYAKDWIRKKCVQLLNDVWIKKISQGFVRPLLDEFVSPPKTADDIVPEEEDERFLVENRTFMIWANLIEIASKLWPERSEERRQLSSKLLPIPKTKEQFAEKAIEYTLEQLDELPLSHRYNHVSRPPPPPYADTSVDRAVARRFYKEGPSSFAKKVNNEYRQLCEELIDLVGDRFVTAELMQHCLVSTLDESTSSPPSAMSSSQLSGELGRPSLARLSVGSGLSIGRCSWDNSGSPLRVVHEGKES